MAGFLFFGFIIVSYGVGIWVGMKIKETKSVTKKTTGTVNISSTGGGHKPMRGMV